jgi:DNA-binding response OmpR family regulator
MGIESGTQPAATARYGSGHKQIIAIENVTLVLNLKSAELMHVPLNRPVLLLEDQPLIALDLEDLLLGAGMREVICLRSVEEGLSWLEDGSPLVIIVDYHLSDGASLSILQLAKQRCIPCVVHSAVPMPDDVDRDLIEDMPWLDKPCDPDMFVATVLATAETRHA